MGIFDNVMFEPKLAEQGEHRFDLPCTVEVILAGKPDREEPDRLMIRFAEGCPKCTRGPRLADVVMLREQARALARFLVEACDHLDKVSPEPRGGMH